MFDILGKHGHEHQKKGAHGAWPTESDGKCQKNIWLTQIKGQSFVAEGEWRDKRLTL